MTSVSALTTAVKSFYPKHVDSVPEVRQQAIQLLKGVLDDAFVKGGSSQGQAAARLPPTTQLAERLLDEGLGILRSFGEAGLTKWLSSQTAMPSARPLADAAGASVTVPGVAQRDFSRECSDLQRAIGVPSLPPTGSRVVSVGQVCLDPISQERFDNQASAATRCLAKYADLLDTSAGIGAKDGTIARCDLEAALKNPNLPAELRESIRFVLANPSVYNQLDVAAGKGAVDGFITVADLQAQLKTLPPEPGKIDLKKLSDILRNFLPKAASYEERYKASTEMLVKHLDDLDTAAGIGTNDDVIGRCDLEAALKNPALPRELKDAIRFLLENPAAFNRLDVASGEGSVDGLISKKDLEAQAKDFQPAAPPAWKDDLGQVTSLLKDIKDIGLGGPRDVVGELTQLLEKLRSRGQPSTPDSPTTATPDAPRTTSPDAPSTTSPGGANAAGSGGSINDIITRGVGNSASLSKAQEGQLANIKDENVKAQLKAQMEMENMERLVNFISKMLQKSNEMLMTIIRNM